MMDGKRELPYTSVPLSSIQRNTWPPYKFDVDQSRMTRVDWFGIFKTKSSVLSTRKVVASRLHTISRYLRWMNEK